MLRHVLGSRRLNNARSTAPGRGGLEISITGMSATHFRIACEFLAHFGECRRHEINPFTDAAQRSR
jgi:hypothetical protein